jgi:hypothetical protein
VKQSMYRLRYMSGFTSQESQRLLLRCSLKIRKLF